MLKPSNYIRNRIIAAIVIFALIVVAFVVFMQANQNRVLETNSAYAKSTTTQTAERVDDLLISAQEAISTAARIYQDAGLTYAINENTLQRIAADSMFDFMAYCDAQGNAVGAGGRQINAADSDFYHQGMDGHSGVSLYTGERTDVGDVIMVYAPIWNNEFQVVGVLAGAFNGKTMENMLAETFLGEELSDFLCESDGDIIASSDTFSTDFTNARDIYADNQNNTEFVENVANSFASLKDASFTYNGRSGTGVAYITKLKHFDWMLLCLFPSSITAGIINEANVAGFSLLACISVAFIIFIVMLVLQARRQNNQLLMEKLELNRLVDAVTNLYERFIYIDLEHNTYEYLKCDRKDIPLPIRGSFDVYHNYWVNNIGSDESSEIMRKFLSKEGLQRELSDGRPYVTHEYTIEEPNGSHHWMQGSGVVIKREGGVVKTLLIAIQDIDEMKKREERSRMALEEAYNAAEQASRAKSDFLNSMSHDIRTPMNSIMGLTAIATMYIDDKERVKDSLAKIASSSRHLLGLINEVLDMAKIESGNISLSEEDFDLPEAVDNLLTIIKPQVDAKHQELKIDIADIKHEHVIGDPMRLQQVFVNIMGNSVKFTPEGGTIGMIIRELPSKIHGAGHYQFTFTDTGCGMSEEFVQKVFEPFSRANDSRVTKVEGTGLGMSIVKSVVNLMNGTIDVHSKLGEGTTFTIEVYLKLRDVESVDATGLAGMPVLVADDDQLACESAAALLEEIGMESEWVLSGDEAIERVAARSGTEDEFVAVILDWRMPGKSGIETAREIRKIVGDELPIIILSAYDWSFIEQEARESGVDAFISKPLFRSRLIHVMSELLLNEDYSTSTELDDLQKQDFSEYRILLVEDNPLAAAIAQDLLDITKVEVDHAENGKVAVELLQSKPEGYFDLVFMDVQMPIMNGYEATKAIRASGRPDLEQIPIIALTADAFNDDVLKAKNAGMNAHMSKPMEINALITTLNTWLK